MTLKLENRTFYVDLGAERLIAAEKDTVKIAVEIKTFLNPSPVADLEQALGQFGIYEEVLKVVQPERSLYPAVPQEAFDRIFTEQIGQLILQNRIRRAFTFSWELEEIVQWIP